MITSIDDPRFDEVLGDYLRRIDRGETIDREQFLTEHADVAELLREYLETADLVEQMAGPPVEDSLHLGSTVIAEASSVCVAGETIFDGNEPRSIADHPSEAQNTTAAEDDSVTPETKPARLPGQGPEVFGRYRILDTLGEGGMGAVYLAEDTRLRREVALKMPKFSRSNGEQLLARFYSEATAAATVHHPNLCPVFDVGEIDGQHYITMACIKGQTLRQQIDAGQTLSQVETAQILRKIAEALEEAHSHGIVHRDLKPANVMIDHRGEPIVMDFGLARQLQEDEQTRLTHQGTLVGTPAYMAPEQVESEPDQIGPATDIYSLGVMLYELLTGRLPFRGSMTAVLGQIVHKQPKKPSQIRPDVDPRLETICLKMMSKDSAKRYNSMSAVADALREYLQSPDSPPAWPIAESVVPPNRGHNGPLFAAASALLFVGLLLAGIVYYIQTDYGVVRVEVADESLLVKFNGQTITMKDGEKELTIRPGGQKLIVKRDGLELSTDNFEIRRGDVVAIKIELLRGKVVVLKDGRPFGAKSLPNSVPHSPADSEQTGSDSVIRLYTVSDKGDLMLIELSGRSLTTTLLRRLGSDLLTAEGLTRAGDTLYAAVNRSDGESRLFSIDLDTLDSSLCGTLGVHEVDGLAWVEGELLGVTSRLSGNALKKADAGRLLKINPATGRTHPVGNDLGLNDLDSLVYDGRGRLTTTDGLGLNDQFYELDRRGITRPKSLAPTPRITASRDVEGLAQGSDGMYYAVTNPGATAEKTSYLLRIDPETFRHENLGKLPFGTYCLAADRRELPKPR